MNDEEKEFIKQMESLNRNLFWSVGIGALIKFVAFWGIIFFVIATVD